MLLLFYLPHYLPWGNFLISRYRLVMSQCLLEAVPAICCLLSHALTWLELVREHSNSLVVMDKYKEFGGVKPEIQRQSETMQITVIKGNPPCAACPWL